MSPLEQAAFVRAYGTSVADVPDERVAEFIKRYSTGEDVEYSHDYTSIVDAYGMWNAGIEYARAQAQRKSLIDQVLEQMKLDIKQGDFTAIEELLLKVDEKILQGYLPEQ